MFNKGSKLLLWMGLSISCALFLWVLADAPYADPGCEELITTQHVERVRLD